MRSPHLLPKRDAKPEWQHAQDDWAEKDDFPAIDFRDNVFVFGRERVRSTWTRL